MTEERETQRRERELVLSEYGTWRITAEEEAPVADEIRTLETLLRLKAEQLASPDPGLWTEDLATALLTEVMPRTVVQPREQVMDVVPTLVRFVAYLRETGRWHAESMSVGQVSGVLGALEFAALEAADDPTRRSFSTNILGYGLSLGVDLEDEDELAAFMHWYNGLPDGERLALSETGRLEAPSHPYDRAEALRDRNADELVAAGAKELVCVCPGCANDMRKALAKRGLDVEVRLLADWLHERGFAPKHALPDGPLCLSKSCQDRDGTYLEQTRAALGLDEGAFSIFDGCCGAGGAVSAFDPARQAEQADGKLSFAPDGATVVSMCPTCTYTYAYRLMESPRNVANKHYCELLFDSQFDWDKTFAQLGGMWSGEYGPWLAQVFA